MSMGELHEIAGASPVRPEPGPGRAGLAVAVLVAVGIATRVTAWLLDPTLFIDEAMLALNVVLRSPAELFRPLDFEQVAPVLYLLVQRGAVAAAGVDTRVLRLLAVVASVAAVIAMPRLARQFGGLPVAIVATGLLALSPELLTNSYRVKPYATDVAVTIALILFAVAWAPRPGRRGRWLALGATGVLAVTFSHPAVFVLAGIWGWLALRTPRTSARVLAALAVAWVVPALLLYVLVYRADALTNAYLESFWRSSFFFERADLSWPSRLVAFAAGALEPLFGWAKHPVALTIGAGGFLAGAWLLARRCGAAALLVLGPLACAWLAYVFGFYVAVGRLFDFAAPLLAITIAIGLAGIARAVARGRPTLALAVLALPLGLLQLEASGGALAMIARDEGGAVRALLRDARPDEPVYIYARALPDWIFYTTDWNAPDRVRLGRLLAAAERAGPNSGNPPPRGRPVRDEGFALTFPFRESAEIIGVPSGVVLGPRRIEQPRVDAGWAENEIERIRRQNARTTWAVLWQESPPLRALTRAAAERGGCLVLHDDTRIWMAIYQVQFPCRRG